MKIATWNINSIRTRLPHVLRWLEENQPDALCLQETKVEDDRFPWVELEAIGYSSLAIGEKAYNGVAILAKERPSEVMTRLPGDPADEECRFLSVNFRGIRLITVYAPNGDTVGSERWEFKLEWYQRLRAYLNRHSPDEKLLLCGDMNIAPDPEKDTYRADMWALSVMCHPDGRRVFEACVDWGLTDLFRQLHPETGRYTWWDYSPRFFKKNEGLRIDHMLATAPLARACSACDIDMGPRGWEKPCKPSDHAPMWATFMED